MHESADDILLEHGLKRTRARIEVLNLFLKSLTALSQPHLEKKIKQPDRTTLYRVLNDFVRAGILHPVVSQYGVLHYSLCHNHCSVGQHNDHHIHFECRSCKGIYCMEDIQFPKLKSLSGYITEKYDFKMVGICKKCRGTED